MIMSPLLLEVKVLMAHFKFCGDCLVFISLNQSEKQQSLILCHISSHIIFLFFYILTLYTYTYLVKRLGTLT